MMKHKSWLVIASLALAALLITALASQPVNAAGPWYVAPGGSDGNTCLSAVSPCATINGALGKASPGDTIEVATGTYTSSSGSEVVLIDKNATLSGGWDSTFTLQTGMSTVDGQGVRRGIGANNGTVAIDHFIVQNGLYPYSDNAGGIGNAGTLTLTNSIVRNNVGTTTYGGGILNGGTLTIINSKISGNKMGTAGFGGAGGGAGINNGYTGRLILNNSTVSGNEMLGGSNGSGIYNDGVITISNSTVSNNIGNGGGIFNSNGTAILNNSTVSGNTDQSGGGISNGYGTLTLNNSTVSGNLGYGGIRNSGTLALNNSTVSGNTSQQYGGGGISNDGTVTLQNSIVAGNTSGGTGPDCSGIISSSGYNLVGNLAGCTYTLGTGDQINVEASLGPLQDNGGSTLTQALLPGSPAIDAGNPAGCNNNSGAPLPFDQRGYLRTGRCDIGAYEYGLSSFIVKGVVGTFRPSGRVTYTLTLNNVPNLDLASVALSDPLPAQVTYIPNSLAVTGGTGAVNNGTVVWTGTVFSNTATVITFAAMISTTAQHMFIVNTAAGNWGGYTFSAAATFDTFSDHVFLPLVARNYCTGPFYTDNFSDPASGWPVGNSASVQYGYLSGEYRLLVKNTNWSILVSSGLKTFDSIVSVDVRIPPTGVYGTYGLVFGLSDNFSQFYDFEIDPMGSYYIYRYGSGTFTPLAQGHSAIIHTGTGTNRIKIERNGSLMKAYANGQLLTSISDGSYTGLRRVGLIAFSYDQPNVDVRFDNFKAYDVACESIARSLSPASQMTDKAAVATDGLSGSGTMTPRSHTRLDILPAGMSPHLSEDRSHHQ